MNNIDEKSLIGLVRNYPLIYDIASPLYNDQQKKEEAWNEISMLVSASVNDCKTKWTRLREYYRKALIVRNKKIGRSKDRAVKHEKELAFLNENMTLNSKKRSIIAQDPDQLLNEVSKEPKVKMLIVENKPEPSKSEATVNKPVKHELNAFFEGIAETVKTFPKKLQVQIKRDVFNLVNNTEAALVNNDSTHSSYLTLDSPMVGGSDYIIGNRIMDNSNIIHNSHSSSSNEYTASPLNLLQTDDMQENLTDIQIKEENII